MSTTLKMGYLSALRKFGKKSIQSTSVFKLPYRITLGDMFSENPFYNDHANVGEILACTSWVAGKGNPVIYDIGAHGGFISTHLAQLLRKQQVSIFCFEPVPPTFSELVASIQQLHVEDRVKPISLALGNKPGFVRLNYSKWASMLAQVIPQGSPSNQRSGQEIYIAASSTLDEVIKELPFPDVIKIDVEGWEIPVFEGAEQLRSQARFDETAICLEWNPEAQQETGFSASQLFDVLHGYRFFYINDYCGQQYPLLSEVSTLRDVGFVCNVMATKAPQQRIDTWKKDFLEMKARYQVSVG